MKYILNIKVFNYLWSIFDISKTIRWYLLPIKYINRFTQRIRDRLTPFKLSLQPENTSIHFYLRYKIIPISCHIHLWPWAKHIFVQWKWLSYSERKTQKDEVNWIELILNDVKYNEYRRVRRRQWLLCVKYIRRLELELDQKRIKLIQDLLTQLQEHEQDEATWTRSTSRHGHRNTRGSWSLSKTGFAFRERSTKYTRNIGLQEHVPQSALSLSPCFRFSTADLFL